MALDTVPLRIVHASNFGFKPTKVFMHGVAAKLSNGWVRAGHHVINFSDRDVARWTSPFGHRKLGVGPANQALLGLCKSLRPEVLALGHADVIRPATVAAIREALPDLKVLQWNVDLISDDVGGADNSARIRSKQDLVDATFISTAGELLRPFSGGGRTVAFMPNPVDASLERGRNFEREALPNDLFVAVGGGQERRFHAGLWRTTDDLVAAIMREAPQASISIHGVLGRPMIAGPAYEEAILSCAAGLNFSRRGNNYLYSSDRIAHLAGNGLAVHIDRGTAYGELFGEDQFVFYSSEAELFDNIARIKREPAMRRAIAEAGWRRYFQLFDSTIIGQYMLDVLFGTHDPARYAWPTVFAA